jgi:hypothetical protein
VAFVGDRDFDEVGLVGVRSGEAGVDVVRARDGAAVEESVDVVRVREGVSALAGESVDVV